MTFRDTCERLLWTVVAAASGALIAPAVFDFSVSALQAAAIAGVGAAVNFVTIVARARLAVLPDPGAGLPGLPVE